MDKKTEQEIQEMKELFLDGLIKAREKEKELRSKHSDEKIDEV